MGKPNLEDAAPVADLVNTLGPAAAAGVLDARTKAAAKPPARPMFAPIAQGTELQAIPLASLSPSPTNPRKHFDEADLKELAQSYASVGLVEPPVVRKAKVGLGLYELVVGERRWRAAKLAGIKELLCIVRDLTDEQVLRIQIIENLQRKDVNPIEEAEGYQVLVQKGGYVLKDAAGEPVLHPVTKQPVPDLKRIAAEIGKSERYVGERLALARKLLKPVMEAAAEGYLSASHAVELARLEPADQAKAFSAIFEGTNYRDADRCQPEELLKDLRGDKQNKPSFHIPVNSVLSVRALQEFIAEEIQRKLADAVFDPKDEQLCPAAGPCTLCHKRTDYEFGKTALGAKSCCLDPKCFEAKRVAHVKAVAAAEKAKGNEVVVVTAVANWQGSTLKANGQEYQPAKAGDTGAVKAVDKKTGKTSYVKPVKEKAEKKETEEDRKVKAEKLAEKMKLATAFRRELFKAVAERVMKGSCYTSEALAEIFRDELSFNLETMTIVAPLMGWKDFNLHGGRITALNDEAEKRLPKLTPENILRLAALCKLGFSDCTHEWELDHEPENLVATAKRMKLDLESFRAKAKEQVYGAAKPAPAKSAVAALGQAAKANAAKKPKTVKEWMEKQRAKPAAKAKKK